MDLSIRASLVENQQSRQPSWGEDKAYPVLLTGKQAEIVIETNRANPNGKGFPAVVISGRLFRAPSNAQCYVLCKHIQFTGIYGSLE
jgi:hypothetical protein